MNVIISNDQSLFKVSYRIIQTMDVINGDTLEHNVTVQAYDHGPGNLATNHVLVVVNQVKCTAMRFSINERTGLVTVQNLCSVSNAQDGDLTVLLHSNIKLTCNATSNLDNVDYRWVKDGVVVSDWSKNGDWMLKDVLHEHKGSYACIASNDAGVVQSTLTNLIVHGKFIFS